jgi:hypothetical protein
VRRGRCFGGAFQAGHLSVREAAVNRIAALEAHPAKCQELRRKYLGEGQPAQD